VEFKVSHQLAFLLLGLLDYLFSFSSTEVGIEVLATATLPPIVLHQLPFHQTTSAPPVVRSLDRLFVHLFGTSFV